MAEYPETAPRDDKSRTHLVTVFACAGCNRPLRISRTVSGKERPSVNDGITGADKVVSYIKVYPCRHCYGKASEPARKIREALDALGEVSP